VGDHLNDLLILDLKDYVAVIFLQVILNFVDENSKLVAAG
jgi:hypothetical protein